VSAQDVSKGKAPRAAERIKQAVAGRGDWSMEKSASAFWFTVGALEACAEHKRAVPADRLAWIIERAIEHAKGR
jgi:hypothetical protein